MEQLESLYANWVTIAPDSKEFLSEVDVETAKIAPLTDSVSTFFTRQNIYFAIPLELPD